MLHAVASCRIELELLVALLLWLSPTASLTTPRTGLHSATRMPA
jgi:hypothetical protein